MFSTVSMFPDSVEFRPDVTNDGWIGSLVLKSGSESGTFHVHFKPEHTDQLRALIATLSGALVPTCPSCHQRLPENTSEAKP